MIPFFIIIDLIILSVSIVILKDTYKSIKKKLKLSNDDFNFIDLFKTKMKSIFQMKREQELKYIEKDIMKEFTVSTNKLVSCLSKVIILLFYLF